MPLPAMMMARDLMHSIVGETGPDGALYKTMEFSGPAVSAMSIDERITLCNLANHAGAKAAVVNPDEKTLEKLVTDSISNGGQVLVFVNSRRSTASLASMNSRAVTERSLSSK
jgi:homoaconitase/3-isopropylmalate dehydratase large subunit